MQNSQTPYAIPDQLKFMLTLVMSIVTAVLYVLVLGGAVLRTINETDPVFSSNAVRAAGLLSGLVGAVVTAGFARGRSADAASGTAGVPVAFEEPVRASRARVKMVGLARMIGFPAAWGAVRRGGARDDTPADDSGDDVSDAPSGESAGLSVTVWVALLYFAVYSLVGLAAFLLTAFRPEVPEIVASSAWVWLGTVLTSSYSFFGLDSA